MHGPFLGAYFVGTAEFAGFRHAPGHAGKVMLSACPKSTHPVGRRWIERSGRATVFRFANVKQGTTLYGRTANSNGFARNVGRTIGLRSLPTMARSLASREAPGGGRIPKRPDRTR